MWLWMASLKACGTWVHTWCLIDDLLITSTHFYLMGMSLIWLQKKALSIRSILFSYPTQPSKQEVPCSKGSLNKYDGNLELSALRTFCSESRQLVTYYRACLLAILIV